MADGSGTIIHGRIVGGPEAGQMTLAHALAAGHVVSRCSAGCGHVESVDTSEWEASRPTREASLRVLARHLRCMCGCKEVRVEVWPVRPEPVQRRAYFWR